MLIITHSVKVENHELISLRFYVFVLICSRFIIFRGSSMVERRPVNKTCSSLRKLRDELFGISVKATSKDMLIPREPRHYVWGTVETRYRNACCESMAKI